MKKVFTYACPSRPSKLSIGRALFRELASDIAGFPRLSGVYVIADEKLAELWGDALLGALREALSDCDEDAGLSAELLSFPSGEASKSREVKAELEDKLLALGADRDAAIIAFGGGVATDLVGYVAATYLRGVRLVLVPTTVLAMADSSLGGKCGINTPAGKNLLGAFYPPEAVYMDLDLLTTLPEREYREGLVEVFKTGCVACRELLPYFEDEAKLKAFLERDPDVLEQVIGLCADAKLRLVEADLFDRGPRHALNYGHTYGHAVEQAVGYRMRHGECVALGMLYAANKARRAGICTENWALRQEKVLGQLVKPMLLEEEMEPIARALASALKKDKKSHAGHPHWIYSPAPGEWTEREE